MISLIFKLVKIAATLIVVLALALVFVFRIQKKNSLDLGVISFSKESENLEIRIGEDKKPVLKKVAKKLEDIIYYGATKYNPDGDVLPDDIDDKVKGKIKDVIN